MNIKHFIDIENLREFDIDLGIGVTRRRNNQIFEPGDEISITEKIDGSNASIRYDLITGKLAAFSRKKELSSENTLRGFYGYVQSLDAREFSNAPQYSIFGEWLVPHKIKYRDENNYKWYVYSIYDNASEKWLKPSDVKIYAKSHGLIYINELYYGPFISWEHCRSFMNNPNYGEQQEGIVIRNISKINNSDNRNPHILKIVNENFAETKRVKIVDPEKVAEKDKARDLIGSIITRNRVEKMLAKLSDEGIIPDEIMPKDMKIVAKHLPKCMYEDCMKEEPEIMLTCNEYAGKMCGSITMNLAKEIILG